MIRLYTHTAIVKAHTQEFTDYLNSIDDHIKWTTEWELITLRQSNEEVNIGARTERALAFLDIWLLG